MKLNDEGKNFFLDHIRLIVFNQYARILTLMCKKLHEIAGCGLYMKNNEILSGDLSGNIFQWNINDTEPKQHIHIPDSVRCFVSDNLVGTLSGALYNIDTQDVIEDFQTTIICSAWNQSQTSCLIGLGDGRLMNFQTRKIIGQHDNNADEKTIFFN